MTSDHGHSRRRFLALAGAVAGAGATGGFAAPRVQGGLIDVHHHILPPNAPPPLAHLMAGWSAAGAVAEMDAAGVAAGIAFPGQLLGSDLQQNRALARDWNEFGAQIGRDFPGRFGLFASLPLADPDGSIAEIDHAFDHLRADGFGVSTNYGEAWLGDTRFWPIYEKLNDRRAVVFVHPADAPCCAPARMSYMADGMDGSWIEWPMNTARTILSLMTSGTLRRYPDIRFIFAHGGGVTPLLVNRIAGLSAWSHVGPDKLKAMFPDGVRAEFSRLHFECAQACSPTNMAALRSLVPDTNILFGSDYPIFPLAYGSGQFAKLRLAPATRRMIARGNAQALLPRWASPLARAS